MIGTIGSLVQETSRHWRWLVSASLYTGACLSSAMFLGAVLGILGHFLSYILSTLFASTVAYNIVGVPVVGLLAVAYAASDIGLISLPRPVVMHAVPLIWWRRWGPYGGAIAYGAALGLGVTTRIMFGSFYVLCAWCIVKGDCAYGALLMGAYGAARSLVIFPVSWSVYRYSAAVQGRVSAILSQLLPVRCLVAVVLIMFGVQIAIATILSR